MDHMEVAGSCLDVINPSFHPLFLSPRFSSSFPFLFSFFTLISVPHLGQLQSRSGRPGRGEASGRDITQLAFGAAEGESRLPLRLIIHPLRIILLLLLLLLFFIIYLYSVLVPTSFVSYTSMSEC